MRKTSTKLDWQTYWQSIDHQPTVTHPELLENLGKSIDIKNKHVLEIGAGMGGDSLYLARHGAFVSVLDFTQEALDKINQEADKNKIRIKTILADAKNIPLPDNSIDIVFHQGFLEHFVDPNPFLTEQHRILKKGGILVVDVPQKFTTYTLKKHWQMRQGKWFAGWETEFSIGQLEGLLRRNGFRVLRSYGWGYFGQLNNLRNLKLGKFYEQIWHKIEASRLKLYLNFAIGVVAKKE